MVRIIIPKRNPKAPAGKASNSVPRIGPSALKGCPRLFSTCVIIHCNSWDTGNNCDCVVSGTHGRTGTNPGFTVDCPAALIVGKVSTEYTEPFGAGPALATVTGDMLEVLSGLNSHRRPWRSILGVFVRGPCLSKNLRFPNQYWTCVYSSPVLLAKSAFIIVDGFDSTARIQPRGDQSVQETHTKKDQFFERRNEPA
ncbi:hypothetical protein GW17_00008495 [Ensete ventricosum]|nr:hypothetical protein GW17_00008495 [Ensete ventricosum]